MGAAIQAPNFHEAQPRLVIEASGATNTLNSTNSVSRRSNQPNRQEGGASIPISFFSLFSKSNTDQNGHLQSLPAPALSLPKSQQPNRKHPPSLPPLKTTTQSPHHLTPRCAPPRQKPSACHSGLGNKLFRQSLPALAPGAAGMLQRRQQAPDGAVQTPCHTKSPLLHRYLFRLVPPVPGKLTGFPSFSWLASWLPRQTTPRPDDGLVSSNTTFCAAAAKARCRYLGGNRGRQGWGRGMRGLRWPRAAEGGAISRRITSR